MAPILTRQMTFSEEKACRMQFYYPLQSLRGFWYILLSWPSVTRIGGCILQLLYYYLQGQSEMFLFRPMPSGCGSILLFLFNYSWMRLLRGIKLDTNNTLMISRVFFPLPDISPRGSTAVGSSVPITSIIESNHWAAAHPLFLLSSIFPRTMDLSGKNYVFRMWWLEPGHLCLELWSFFVF